MTPRYRTMQVEELGTRILPSVSIITPADGPRDLLNSVGQVASLDTDHDHREVTAGPQQFGSTEAFRQYLIDQAVEQYKWYFGQELTYYPYYWGFGLRVTVADNSTITPLVSASASYSVASGIASGTNNPTYSDTNTQERGVDEGDIVETDGDYLYVLAHNKLVILDARSPADLKSLSVTIVPGNCLAEYLHGDRLTVISQEYYPLCICNDAVLGISATGALWSRPNWSPPQVSVTVFDVSDRAAPKVVQETTLEGSYLDSRAVGDKVYVALSNYLNRLPEPAYTITKKLERLGDTRPYTTGMKPLEPLYWEHLVRNYESEASYRARLEAMPLKDLLPQYRTTWTDKDGAHERVAPLVTPADLYRPKEPGDNNLVSLVEFDIHGKDAGPTASVSLLTNYTTTVYATRDNLYLVSNRWTADGYVTSIDKLSLHGQGIELTASGEVPGRIVDQFSLGEHGQYLYIATTTGWGWGASSHVYVLAENHHSLDIVGQVDDIAPGETIFSVRFVGNRGFVSTFRRIDPLFAIDLSNPTAPVVKGQLEVTGFNDYLQAIDETHLIGIGKDGGHFQVSLYDVSDLNQPTLVSRYTDDAAWSGSQAEYDQHALTYYPEYQALTLTVSGYSNDWQYHSSQLVFHVDVAHGSLDVTGEVTDSSPIQRGVFIGNMLYSISGDSVQVHALNDLETLVAQVQLPAWEYVPVGGWWRPLPVLLGPPVTVIIPQPVYIAPHPQPVGHVSSEDQKNGINDHEGKLTVHQPAPAVGNPSVIVAAATAHGAQAITSGTAPVGSVTIAAPTGEGSSNPAAVPAWTGSVPNIQMTSGSAGEAGQAEPPSQAADDASTPQTQEQEAEPAEEISDDAWGVWRDDAVPATPTTRVTDQQQVERWQIVLDDLFAGLATQRTSPLWALGAAVLIPFDVERRPECPIRNCVSASKADV